MTIIKQGKEFKEKYKTKCEYCECKFRYGDDNIETDWASIVPKLYVECPWCNKRVEIK